MMTIVSITVKEIKLYQQGVTGQRYDHVNFVYSSMELSSSKYKYIQLDQDNRLIGLSE